MPGPYVEDSLNSSSPASAGLNFKYPFQVGGNLYGQTVTDNQNQVAAASYAVSHTVFVNPLLTGTWKLAAVSATFGTASTSGTLQVEVATGTQAIASGTNQLSGTISLAGTANTVVSGTVSVQTTIVAGARVNLIFAGTVTNLANATVTLNLQRLS